MTSMRCDGVRCAYTSKKIRVDRRCNALEKTIRAQINAYLALGVGRKQCSRRRCRIACDESKWRYATQLTVLLHMQVQMIYVKSVE